MRSVLKFTAVHVALCLAFVVSASATADKPAASSYQRPVLFTGELQAADSVPIIVPTSNTSPVPIRYYVPEGSKVKSGDVILRIDTQGDTDIERLELEIVQNRERGLREAADLEVKTIEAERALITAQAALAKAKIDAALPKAQISALDYDKYQGELDRATRDFAVKQKALENAKEAVKRKLEDSDLAVKRLHIQIAFAKVQVAQSEVRASRDGVVIHGYDDWNGKRLDEGGHAQIGSVAGQIIGAGKLNVIAWVLEADRPFLQPGQELHMRFDAIPNSFTKGVIERIASAPEARAIWGKGRYFKTEIRLPDNLTYELQQGMSVAIETIKVQKNPVGKDSSSSQKAENAPSKITSSASVTAKNIAVPELTLEGEVLSRQSQVISPPTIRNVWNYNLVMLAAEGSHVKVGEPVAIFEANDAKTKLDTHRSSLKEKQRSIEKTTLDHAEAAKAADLAVSEAKSNAEKALRKASLPKELVKRIDYDKLVIERDLFTQLAGLSERQREAQQRARTAELRGLKSETAQLQQTISILEKGLNGLTVIAPRAGTVVHNVGFDDEKFAVGSRVFMGAAVANLADPDKIFVAAKVPEAQVSLVKIGQLVSVTTPGSNTQIAARISGFGPVFHGKSANQPMIVRDIEIEFDSLPKNLKPGTAVQVKLANQTAGAPALRPSAAVGAKK
ncbi:HlyD family efflux transporter periplasmic adaptor subunit [Undibacterium seohonense]|uniref:HlyD family efflux transporter periplasmic adaptor subunit n=1 Tax=Undibacterium seohonense TaxID=1344950 RepID=A0ABR6X3M8_9BURK|nr:HlyD family secretion protein [Undibacterium seohonense]MBC3807402.1 HlyD family efflux transporter periplasmic adaptor subunit [Undibacterium seohonense]